MSKTDEELELSRNVRRKRKPLRAKSRDFSETSADDARALEKEVDDIRLSLDVLKDSLILQQYVLARDFEARIREVYDDVINDINDIRQRVNAIGDTFKTDTKFKKWTPLMPFRKDVLQSVYHVRPAQTSKLKGSRSVDFVDQRGREPWPGKSDEVNFDRFQSKTIFSQRQSWLGSSQSSISSTCSSRKVVPGFGCCFNGDGKTVPYRSFRAGHQPNRSHRHSWGPSRSGSRSALDEDEPEDRSCLCGSVSEDWRAKVVPYMAGGWPVPGIDRSDIEKLRERIEQMETMRHDIVNVHNEYRRQHGCPDLSVTTDLARESQQWSDILATRGYAQYSDTQDRGENILVVDIEDSLSGRQVVDTWYRESRFYNYKTPRWQRGTSNFTQMIWHSSQFIGVGIAKFPNDNTYVVVVQYQPPGNINTTGKFRLNVPVPIARKDQKRKENCASEYKPTNDSIMESQLRGIKSDTELTTNTADIKPTNNTSECGSAKIKLEIELTDQIPDGIGIGNESFKDPPFLSNSLKETDIEKVNELQGNDNALKQKASPACSSGEWQNGTVDSQSYVKEFVTGNEGIDLIDNLFAGLTEKEVDIVIADSPEDNIDDDLENSTAIASVSALQASSVCDNNLMEEWKHEIQ